MLPHWIWGPESILEFSFQYECQRMSRASALTQLGDTPILLRHPAMAKAKGSIGPEKCNGSKRNRDCTQPEPTEIGRKCA